MCEGIQHSLSPWSKPKVTIIQSDLLLHGTLTHLKCRESQGFGPGEDRVRLQQEADLVEDGEEPHVSGRDSRVDEHI